jgi:hypothetical protein
MRRLCAQSKKHGDRCQLRFPSLASLIAELDISPLRANGGRDVIDMRA